MQMDGVAENGLPKECIAIRFNDHILIHIAGITKEQVKAKWNNLRAKYLKYKDKMRATGESRVHPPPCIDLLDEILGDRHATAPQNRMCLGPISESHPPSLQARSPAPNPQAGPSWLVDHLPQFEVNEPQPQAAPKGATQPRPASQGATQPRPAPQVTTQPQSEPQQPQLHDSSQPGSPDPVEEVPVAVELNIRNERRRLRGRRRLRPETHSMRMEELGNQHLTEVERHNRRVEELLQQRNEFIQEQNNRMHDREVEKVAILRELLEEYKRRGPPPE